MAKAKKSTAKIEGEAPAGPAAAAKAEPAPAPQAAAAETPKPAAKKVAAKKAPAAGAAKAGGAKGKGAAAKPAARAGAPLIDTNLAAQAAARMIAAKVGPAAAAGGERKETSTFKQLKDSLAKGHATGVSTLLNNTMSPAAKKSASLPFGGHGGKQVGGHNQTFGSDANRNFVPRRTGGG